LYPPLAAWLNASDTLGTLPSSTAARFPTMLADALTREDQADQLQGDRDVGWEI
jgi:hypothetical protein